ncbi:alpha-mannosidase 2x-like [Eriocheir sinensis]|uniref:alpha-mannosidase 2x-like n=1 Tax=Eriocheir sinensis TaxID=95602 RepID=UPI0021C8AD25|nr:alpha-mannosidase 2x-like [Eriocheir sinensis]
MRLRYSSMVFGVALCLATLVLLYQVLSLPGDISPPGEQKEILSLESRLRRLENNIQANQHTISEIKSLVRQLSKTSARASSILGTQIGAHPNKFVRNGIGSVGVEGGAAGGSAIAVPGMKNLSHASVMPDDCVFATMTTPPVDMSMDRVYEQLKFDNPDGGAWKQGWDIKFSAEQWTPENKLRVFVVPHSHNDPGWIKTLDQYYHDQTRHILDLMVEKLPVDERRKFIWAEISYLSMWWDQQTETTRNAVRRLLERGQLEVVTGGWVMSDEANTHYFALLEQMLEGHEWMKLNLGVKPNNGWAIDPFGLTPTVAYLHKRMGLENMVIQRAHYSIKKHLAQERSLEFRWRQAWDPGTTTEILTHLMPFYSYDIPHTCGPDPKVCCQFDFRRLPGTGITCPWRVPPQPITDHNVHSRALLLLDQYRRKAQLFRTNTLLVPLGDDFRYTRADEWDQQYTNYQRLFDHLNAQTDLHVELQFGTLADYFRALHEAEGGSEGPEEKAGLPSLSGDFFTYADRDDHYWSGYYTSRPFYKSLNRLLEGYLRGAEVLFSLALASQSALGSPPPQGMAEALMARLVVARRNLALFQHHDGITGTAKDHVVTDYALRLVKSVDDCQHIIQQSAHYLLSMDQRSYQPRPDTVFYELGEKFTEHTRPPSRMVLGLQEGVTVVAVVYNPDPHRRTQLLTIRTSTPYVEIVGPQDKPTLCQVDPVFLRWGEVANTLYDVTFLADLPGLSLTSYSVRAVGPDKIRKELVVHARVMARGPSTASFPPVFPVEEAKPGDPIVVEGAHLSTTFDPDGLLQSMSSQGRQMKVKLEFVKYGVRKHQETSGAYLFLPDKEAEVVAGGGGGVVVVRGPLRTSVTSQHKHVLHSVHLASSPGVDGWGLDIHNTVDISPERNFELAMRVSSDLDSGNTFFTDLNGFQITKRLRYDKLPLQGNYYPIPSQAFIQDTHTRLTILAAQPVGGASLKPGQMEVMMDRRLNQDDNRGLGQGVLDNVATPNMFRLLLEPRLFPKESGTGMKSDAAFPSLLAHASLHSLLYPVNLLLPTDKTGAMQPRWSVTGELPCDVHLVTLRTMLEAGTPAPAPHQPPIAFSPSPLNALLLHRIGFDCGFKSPGVSCSTNGGKVRLSDLFPTLFGERVHQMSLSMLYEGVDMTKAYTLSLQPMEVYALRLSRTS